MSARLSVWFSRDQARCERSRRRGEHVDAAGIERCERVAALHDVQRRAPLAARFGEHQRAVVELEHRQRVARRRLAAARASASRPAIIRWMTTKSSPSSASTMRLPRRSTAFDDRALRRRDSGGATVRSRNGLPIAHALEPMADDARREALDVDRDVGQLGHRTQCATGADNRRASRSSETPAARGPTMADLASVQLAKEVRRRRTFAIISHPDAGKTTLTEKLLLFSGAIQIAGSVKARKASRHATSDWMEIEKQRGISVASSVMQMEYRDCVINLLDTPGHQDFSEDTYRVLTAVDAALMVIDAANGVEPQTRRLLQVCRARNTPILTFVNKMDREVQEPLALMDEIERELGMSVRAVHLAGRHGQALRRRDRPAREADARVHAGRGPRPATTTRS